MQSKWATKLHMLAAAVLVLASASAGAAGLTTARGPFQFLLSALLLLSALFLGMNRNTFLPFLGPAAIPPGALTVRSPEDATLTVTVTVPEGTSRVLYWAADVEASTPRDAYYDTTNAGVAHVINGRAELLVSAPAVYKAGLLRRSQPPHVHYRCIAPNGLASEVMTAHV